MNRNNTDEEPLDEKRLRRYLNEHLPDYMVPKVFIFIDEMPLTRNGKVDRPALLSLKMRNAGTGANHLKPQTQMEHAIAAVWQRVLQIEKIGINENFFEVGGHSLLLLEVGRELHKELAREVRIVDLFQHPTIELLAGYLSREPVEEDLLKQASQRAEKRGRAFIQQKKLARGRRNINE